MQWSYGVTCWEVFTCGGVSYAAAGVPVTTLLSELAYKNGAETEALLVGSCG